MPETLVGLVVVIAIAGVLLWALSRFPIDPALSNIIRVLVIVVVAIMAIYFVAGVVQGGGSLRLR